MWAASLRLALVEVAGVPFEAVAATPAAASLARAAHMPPPPSNGNGHTHPPPGNGKVAGGGAIAEDVEAGVAAGAAVASAAELAALGAVLDKAFADFLAARDSTARLGVAWGVGDWKELEEVKEVRRRVVPPGAEARRLLSAVGGAAGARGLAARLAAALRSALCDKGASSATPRLPAWMGDASPEALATAALHNFIHADLHTGEGKTL